MYKNLECSNNCCGLCCTKIENFNVTIGKKRILRDINLHIHCGELTAIIGPNGAGKTTLLKTIIGEVKHKGSIKFVDAKGIRGGMPLIGYVPQHLNFDASTPTSVIDLFSACNSRIPACVKINKKFYQKVYENLSKVKAEHLIDRRIGALSGGEMQRVLLALALEPIPDLLLLDEPVSGIDQNGLDLFYNTVSELREKYDLSIILVSHDLDLVFKYADRVVLLKEEILCNGTPLEVFTNDKMVETFGMSWYRNVIDTK
jgi:zinc transport system ATP-binding protein